MCKWEKLYDYCALNTLYPLLELAALTCDFYFLLQSDVNTVCFADETGHLLYSGSDDNLCKVDLHFSLVENHVTTLT